MSFNSQSPGTALHFFTHPWAYVLGRCDARGALCPDTEDDGLVRCHLSSMDALIEGAQLLDFGEQRSVMLAGLVEPHWFDDADGKGHVAGIHLGWPACDGVLLTRPSGILAPYYRRMHYWKAPAPQPQTFEIDRDVLTLVDRLYEHAGLFAWKESMAALLRWSPARLARMAKHALASVKMVRGEEALFNQIALFDPECAQWHFVSRHVADIASSEP